MSSVDCHSGHVHAGYTDGTVVARAGDDGATLWWERTPVGQTSAVTRHDDALYACDP